MTNASTRAGARIVGVRTALIFGTITVTVVAVLTVLLLRAVAGARDDDQVAATRSELREQASSIVAEVMSVDIADTDADRARARALVTGEFAASTGDALTAPPPTGVASIRWRPVRTALTDTGTGWGETLLAFDVTTVGTAACAAPIVTRRALAARFEQIDGRWLLTRAEVIS